MGSLIEDTSLRDEVLVFKDRDEAASLLSRKLADCGVTEGQDPIVLAVPSGGVPVASGIARALGIGFDLIIVRKVQMPGNPEAGIGAVGPGGDVILNEVLIKRLGMPETEVQHEIERAREVVEMREELFRSGRPFPAVDGRTVVITDDGLASGYSMLSAVEFLKKRSPGAIVVAVPTGPQRTVELILPKVDELVCLNVRGGFSFAVANAYENWYDLGDDEVISILKGFYS